MSVHTSPRESAGELVGWLSALRSRARFLFIALRVSAVAAVFVAAALAGGVLDYLARFPSPIRVGAWCVAVAALGFGLWRWVVPALRLRPSLTDMALRVEKARPDLKGLLAAAVDFEGEARRTPPDHSGEPRLTEALERIVVREAVDRWRVSRSDRSLLNAGPTVRGVALVALVVAVSVAPALVSVPLWFTGVQRILTPWSDAAWPKRTGVADITNTQVHPLGSALPLRAALTKWAGALDSADVTVRYRFEGVEGAAGQTRRELLTLQDQTVRAGEDNTESPVFERLIEPAGTSVLYQFATADDATPWTKVTLVEPPRVESASATIVPPEYAELLSATVDLGTGLDERAVAPPMLAGSRVRLEIKLNKDAALADGATVASIVGDDAIVEREENAKGVISATLVVRGPVRAPIRLIDSYGIESVDEPVFVFGAEPDNPAAAAVTEPSADTRVIATAVVDVTGEGRDDVGLAWVSVGSQRFSPAGKDSGHPSQEGGAVDPVGPEIELGRVDVGDEARTTVSVKQTLDLATLNVEPGDEVHLVATAKDRYEPVDALGMDVRPTDAARSGPRILHVISDDEFVGEIRDALTDVRQAAIRIEAQQIQARDTATERGATSEARRGQSEVSDRVSRQREALARISTRVRQNRLDDQGLSELLQEATETAARAQEASDSAAAGIERAASGAPPDKAAPVDEASIRNQDRALEETRRLIELLDRGEDTWVVESRLRQMVDAQKSLQNRTADVGRKTAGRSMDQLNSQERQQVSDVAKDQAQLADEFDRLLEEMSRREQALRDADPDAAAGMQAAANRARQDQTSAAMSRASDQAGDNQMSNAGEQQARAVESMQQMLADMQNGQQQRDERLRRMLRNLVDSIESLITEQSGAIAELQSASDGARESAGLDEGMITLNRNTSGVAEMARASGPEAGVVASLLESAGGAQEHAISALRASPVDLDNGSLHENRSLGLLREAKKAAEQEQQRQADREIQEKKAKLKAAYREVLERQVAVREQTEEFRGKGEIDRRDRVRLRRLAEPQKDIRTTLAGMVEETPELGETLVFEHAHKRLDDSTGKATDLLEGADADRAAAREDVAIGILQGLVRALDESPPDEDKFQDDKGGGGSGGGGGAGGKKDPLVSAAQELSLLRSMQTVVANETSAVDSEESIDARKSMIMDLAAQQRDLADVASELLSKLGQANPTDILPRPDAPQGDGAEGESGGEKDPTPAPPPPPPSGGSGGAP